jgi:hypothetical protein
MAFYILRLADPGSLALAKSTAPYLVALMLRCSGQRINELQYVPIIPNPNPNPNPSPSTYYSLRTTHYALRTTHYALRTTHYALRTTQVRCDHHHLSRHRCRAVRRVQGRRRTTCASVRRDSGLQPTTRSLP